MKRRLITLLLATAMSLVMAFALAATLSPDVQLPNVYFGETNIPDDIPAFEPYDHRDLNDQYSSNMPKKPFEFIAGTYWYAPYKGL